MRPTQCMILLFWGTVFAEDKVPGIQGSDIPAVPARSTRGTTDPLYADRIASFKHRCYLALELMGILGSLTKDPIVTRIVPQPLNISTISSLYSAAGLVENNVTLAHATHKILKLAAVGAEGALVLSLLMAIEELPGRHALLRTIGINGGIALGAALVDPVANPRMHVLVGTSNVAKRLLQTYAYMILVGTWVTLRDTGDMMSHALSSPAILTAAVGGYIALWYTRNFPSLI